MEHDIFILLHKSLGKIPEDLHLFKELKETLETKYGDFKYIDKIEFEKVWILILRVDSQYNPTKRRP